MRSTAAVGLFVILVLGAFAQSESGLNKDLDSVQREQAEIRRQLNKARTEENRVSRDIRRVDGQMHGIQGSLQDTRRQLRARKDEQARLAEELVTAGELMDTSRERIKTRLRSMYKHGEDSSLMVLMGSEDFASFASRKSMLERIAKRDRELFEQSKQLRQEIAKKKSRQDEAVRLAAELELKQASHLIDLRGARSEKASIVKDLKADQKAFARELAELDRESSRIEAALASYHRSSGGSGPVHSGKFLRPVGGRVSSSFGMRNHPILRKRRMHNGTDFASPTGTAIRAAGAGKVYSAGWQRGYGHTIMIDHGGGIVTLYAHCSRISVKKGQVVAAGDTIGAVGSSGLATGPHLHFEVRIKGKPVNPTGYL
jgi:murein DD-endopeptidase MepM/ murein hydrolase activator NlpD